jgi:hypothetical protein
MKDTPDAYMGICVTSEETAPTQASAYTWNRVRGEAVQLQVADGYIQWKYEADETWTNLIALALLKGDKGDKGDQGPPGEKGEKGDRGDDGLTPILSLGSNGHLYVEYE